MKTYVFEVTKRIVVVVEANTYMAAVMAVEYESTEGEHGMAWHHADAVLNVMHVEELT